MKKTFSLKDVLTIEELENTKFVITNLDKSITFSVDSESEWFGRSSRTHAFTHTQHHTYT